MLEQFSLWTYLYAALILPLSIVFLIDPIMEKPFCNKLIDEPSFIWLNTAMYKWERSNTNILHCSIIFRRILPNIASDCRRLRWILCTQVVSHWIEKDQMDQDVQIVIYSMMGTFNQLIFTCLTQLTNQTNKGGQSSHSSPAMSPWHSCCWCWTWTQDLPGHTIILIFYMIMWSS